MLLGRDEIVVEKVALDLAVEHTLQGLAQSGEDGDWSPGFGLRRVSRFGNWRDQTVLERRRVLALRDGCVDDHREEEGDAVDDLLQQDAGHSVMACCSGGLQRCYNLHDFIDGDVDEVHGLYLLVPEILGVGFSDLLLDPGLLGRS